MSLVSPDLLVSKSPSLLVFGSIPPWQWGNPIASPPWQGGAGGVGFSDRLPQSSWRPPMTDHLATIDIAIVVLYIVGTTLLGAWLSGKQRDVKSYLVGDRNVSMWLVLISIVATETSTVTFLSVPGEGYNPTANDKQPWAGNLMFLQLAIGYVIGRIVIAWLLLPLFMRGELYSAYQILRERFNTTVQRTASAIFLVTRMVADGLRLFLSGLLLQQFTGWSMEWSIMALALATVIYTYVGGMQAIIWTDLVQFAIYIGGALISMYWIISLLGGVDSFVTIGNDAHKFRMFDFDLNFHRPYNFWAGLIGGAVFTMASHGADQLMVQRYLCSRSLNQARTALISSGVVVFLQFFLFLMIGIGLFGLVQKGILKLPQEGIRNDGVFGQFIVHELPTGMVGVLVAAVLASAMTTLSSSMNSAATVTLTDFYRPLSPNRSEAFYLLFTRIMTVVWGLGRVAVALIAVQLGSTQSVVAQVLAVAGFTTGMILGLFALGSLHRHVGSVAALGGMIAGFSTVTAVWLYSFYDPTNSIAWPWYAPIGASVTVLVGLAIHYLRPAYGSSADRGTQPSLDPAR